MDVQLIKETMKRNGEAALGETCRRCKQYQLVAVTPATLRNMINTVHPVLHSIDAAKQHSTHKYLAICPGCDAYALGAELAKPFSFIDADGSTKTIQDTDWW